MKSLILVTLRVFKRRFGEIMEMCTDMCMITNQEIVILIHEEKNDLMYAEIAKITPADRGIEYNRHELLKKFGINTDNRINRIESTIADAFEKSGMAEYARNNKEAADKLQSAMIIAAKELVKQLDL